MEGQPPNDAGMEGREAGGVPSLPSDTIAASQQVIDAGGNKGGRPREDGLVPGSPEATEADKKKDAERKRLARARKGVQQTLPALPPAVGVTNGDAPKADAAALPLVPWKPNHLVRVFKTIVPGLESWTQKRLVNKAAKCPGISPGMLEEIEKDSAWDADAKAEILAAGPEVVSKYLNRMGLSSEYSPEVALLSAFGAIAASHLILGAKIDKWAKAGQSVKPAEETKADA